MAKTSRNDSCPCGSGKKFKKCCENQRKTRTFQVLSSESKIQGISTSLFTQLPSLQKKVGEVQES